MAVTTSGPGTKSMAVMTATERQLTRKIIEEKDERTKAVNDVWRKLDQMQAEVNNLKSTTASAAAVAAAAPSSSPPSQIPPQVSRDLQDLKSELDNQRSSYSNRLSQLDQSVEDLRSSLGRAEMEAQQAVGKCQENHDAFAARVDEDLKALKDGTAPPPGSARRGSGMLGGMLGSARASSKEDGRKSVSNAVAPQAAPADAKAAEVAVAAAAISDVEVERIREQLASLDEKIQTQAKNLTAVRSVLIEVHVNLPLHAVRASRIALRSTELSREERKLALSSLEAKEQHIRADIERVRERNDQSPELALSDLRNIGAEP